MHNFFVKYNIQFFSFDYGQIVLGKNMWCQILVYLNIPSIHTHNQRGNIPLNLWCLWICEKKKDSYTFWYPIKQCSWCILICHVVETHQNEALVNREITLILKTIIKLQQTEENTTLTTLNTGSGSRVWTMNVI